MLTTPYTFFATAGAISRVGARPVFVDVEPHTFNLDPNLIEDMLRRRNRIRAVIPVHLFGGCADMESICSIADRWGIPVIEDAAQAIGAEHRNHRAGGIGQAGAFSFFPSKNLGCYGDGGMVTTNDQATAVRLSALRVHGRTSKYYHEWIGINSRLDTLQAAILRIKLQYLDEWTSGRQRNAERYRSQLACIPDQVIPLTPTEYQTRHVYNQFVIRCQNRNALQAFLRSHAIGTEVYYPLPLHLQPCYSSLGYTQGDFPVSERLADESLALPVQAELSIDDVDYIAAAIRRFHGPPCESYQL